MKSKLLFLAVAAVLFLRRAAPISASGSRQYEEGRVAKEVEALKPLSIQMVDRAAGVLAKGWAGMDAVEKDLFLRLFDPSGSGDVDEQFVTAVEHNYRRIRRALDDGAALHYEPKSRVCEGKRLFYTDLLSLHVCPYFLSESNGTRKSRTLIHEYAHIALLTGDQAYFRPTSKAYARLTPWGSPASRLPIVGAAIRVIAADGTIDHPDAYAHFAVAVSGAPGVLEKYLGQSADFATAEFSEELRVIERSYPLMDSWAR